MRITAVIENIANEYGGPANSLPNLLAAIRDRLSISSIIYSTTRSDDEENEFIERYSIPWVRCQQGAFEKLKYSSELKYELEEGLTGDDILFSNNLWNYPAFLSAQLASKKNIPHVVSIRGSLYPWSLSQGRFRKKVAWYLFQKQALQDASLIHVTCHDEYKAVRELGISSPIAIVPHGINYDDYQFLPTKEQAIERLGLPNDKKYILFMSRLHKKKGLDLLLETWPELVKENRDWCLLVAGPDYSDYSGRILTLASDNNMADNIKVIGMVTGDKKKDVLAVSEFFVLPSHSENFGVVIGEALAAGLPVVTTKGTPWSEINEYDCGKYIDLSKENLGRALKDMMLQEKESLARMSNNGRSLIKNNYSWSAQAVKFGKVLDFIVKGEIARDTVYPQCDHASSS